MQVTENSKKQNKSLSIRVCTDGLSFCVYTPTSSSPYEYRIYKIKSTISLAANLKEALTHEPILKEEYQRVNILISTPHFTVVPIDVFKTEDVNEIYNYNFPKDKPQRVSYNILRRSGISIVFGIERNVYQLILDDFPRARFYASASTLIEFFSERSLLGSNRKMYAYLHEQELTLYAFEQGKLLFVNTFSINGITDCQYYIMNVWQQLGLDQLNDALFVIGNEPQRKDLHEKMRNFIENVSLIDNKEDFKNTIIKDYNMDIPYDLQTLLVCGF
ncbi:MAG: DUF3822 family protein [Bacteroides sp.]|nr:DUF3822 family protein [Roseburia sp.]MCM1347531.1 DUF3822 family protein [Bacteroides sp.]MCM1419862.1 DUF3822 family protein [Bacteroides sp.]